jgi:methyl-accepting chemotaxis protein
MTAVAIIAILALLLVSAGAALLWRARSTDQRAAARLAEAVDRLLRGQLDDRIRTGHPISDGLRPLEVGLEELRGRLRGVVGHLDAWSAGEVAREPGFRGTDDRLASALDATALRMQTIVSEMAAAGAVLTEAGDHLARDLRVVRQAAHVQSGGNQQTAATMGEIAAQIQKVSRGAEHIAAHAGQTATAIQEMVSANGQVARSGESLLRAVDDASSTMETVATSVVSVARTAASLSLVAQQVAQEASSGGQLLEDSAQKLSAASDRTQLSSTAIERLAERSREIGSIVKVIEAIADQTNLLALNAAIEAARAGDAGRGFAVVADEVRKLAERSMHATQEIGEVIEAVQRENETAVKAAQSNLADIRDGVAQVVHASAVLNTILRSIEQVSAQVQDVQRATQEQSFAAGEVMKLVANMNDVTRRVVDATREQAESSRSVLDSAQAITVMTHHVADATAQQRTAGEEVLAELERVRRITADSAASFERLEATAETVAREAAALAPPARDHVPVLRRSPARRPSGPISTASTHPGSAPVAQVVTGPISSPVTALASGAIASAPAGVGSAPGGAAASPAAAVAPATAVTVKSAPAAAALQPGGDVTRRMSGGAH